MRGKGFFTKRALANLLVVCLGILLYLALSNFGAIRQTLGWLFAIISPFIIAIGIAYLLNLPVHFFEEKVYRRLKRRRGLAVFTVYVIALVCIGVLLGLVLPQVIESVRTLASNLQRYITNLNDMVAWLTTTLELEPDRLDFIIFSYQDIVDTVINLVRGSLPNLVNITVQVGSGVVTTLTAVIASIYMLLSKDKLIRQCQRVLYAILPTARADGVLRVGRLSNGVFSGFISGKIIDSAIIGIICFVFMSVMNAWVIPMPFAPLISIVIGLTNIIPVFGPFIGAIPSIMILLLVNPWSAVWFTAFIIILQQFDGNILGPKILGETTGLPALWVLAAIIIGGGFFGFTGMLLGVPTAAVLYTLSSDFVARRLQKKKINPEKYGGAPNKLDAAPESTGKPGNSGDPQQQNENTREAALAAEAEQEKETPAEGGPKA